MDLNGIARRRRDARTAITRRASGGLRAHAARLSVAVSSLTGVKAIGSGTTSTFSLAST
jgi:hypothetical protein